MWCGHSVHRLDTCVSFVWLRVSDRHESKRARAPPASLHLVPTAAMSNKPLPAKESALFRTIVVRVCCEFLCSDEVHRESERLTHIHTHLRAW